LSVIETAMVIRHLMITLFAFWHTTFMVVRADDASAVTFQSEIAPLFKQHCFACHGPAKPGGGLNLEFPPGIRRGGENGEAIVPGSLERSRA
jgi:mono/diheme cytochrome c family protein